MQLLSYRTYNNIRDMDIHVSFYLNKMKVIKLNSAYEINLVPRAVPLGSVILTLRNEDSQVSFSPEIMVTVGNLLKVTITNGIPEGEFTPMSRYEIVLKEDSEVIYLGRLIILDENTDIQNYEYTSQANSRFENI